MGLRPEIGTEHLVLPRGVQTGSNSPILADISETYLGLGIRPSLLLHGGVVNQLLVQQPGSPSVSTQINNKTLDIVFVHEAK